jgi:cell shape-determining protein MreD
MGLLILPVWALTGRLCAPYWGGLAGVLRPQLFHVKTAAGLEAQCGGWVYSREVAMRPTHRQVALSSPGEFQISYTSVLLAVVVGIVHAGLAPEIEIGGVRPNLMLVAVVLVTALMGFGPGIVWAFAGGITANLISTAPIGSIPLSLLLVSAGVAGGDRVLGRLIWLYPILAAFGASLLADLVTIGVDRLMDARLVGDPLYLMLPAATLNAAIVGLLLFPARLATRRLMLDEKPAW